jgi:hypothetical protein
MNGTQRDAGLAGIIDVRVMPSKPWRSRRAATSASLSAAVLEQQPAARIQMRAARCDDGRQRVQPGRPALERERGFVGQQLERGIVAGDIGWIGHDEVEALAWHGVEPGAQAPTRRVTAPVARSFDEATARAPARHPPPMIRARGRSEAMASAMAPLPVPRSETVRG